MTSTAPTMQSNISSRPRESPARSVCSDTTVALAFQLPDELMKEFEKLNLGMVAHTQGVTLEIESTLEQEIRKGQLGDTEIKQIKETIEKGFKMQTLSLDK